MSFHGGLFGIILSIYIYTKLYNLDFFYLSDLIAVVAPIGLFLGRISNFINRNFDNPGKIMSYLNKTNSFYQKQTLLFNHPEFLKA